MSKGEEARNKLIKLLYLSLTALVAILFRYIDSSDYIKINENLENNIEMFLEKHSKFYSTYLEKKNKPNIKNLDVYEKIINLYQYEKCIIQKIDEIKDKLILTSGGYDEKKNIKKLFNKDSVKKIMLEEKNDQTLYDDLNTFTDQIFSLELKQNFINKFIESNEKIKIDFSKNAVVAVIVFLSQIKNNIVMTCDLIFFDLIENLKLERPSILDKYQLIVIPKNENVIVGKDYEANVFLNIRIEDSEPEILVNGEKIEVLNGIGKIKIKTPINLNFNSEGKCKQYLDIKFSQIDSITGDNIKLNKNIQYTVLKKQYIEEIAENTSTFYKMCANEYKVKNNDSDTSYKLTFKVNGGSIAKQKQIQTETFLIIKPTADNCSLHVYRDNINVFDKNFKIKKAPFPKIDIIINDSIANKGDSFDIDLLRNIMINISPDEIFAEKCKNDIKYEIKKWTIYFKKSGDVNYFQDVKNKNEYNFNKSKEILERCDEITIKIDEINRINFAGEIVPILSQNDEWTRTFTIFKKNTEDE